MHDEKGSLAVEAVLLIPIILLCWWRSPKCS